VTRPVAGTGYCVFVWNITGVEEGCRNWAMQLKLLICKRQEGAFLLWADVKERD